MCDTGGVTHQTSTAQQADHHWEQQLVVRANQPWTAEVGSAACYWFDSSKVICINKLFVKYIINMLWDGKFQIIDFEPKSHPNSHPPDESWPKPELNDTFCSNATVCIETGYTPCEVDYLHSGWMQALNSCANDFSPGLVGRRYSHFLQR